MYATGGKGNTRLIAWEGEKTLTFTVEDALLSPMGFAVLSGAGLFKGVKDRSEMVHVHMTSNVISETNEIDLTEALGAAEVIDGTSPIFAVVTEADGSITGDLIDPVTVSDDGKKLIGTVEAGQTVFVDYYVKKPAAAISELQIDASNFAGYYYVEAATLFRRQNDGVDMPAELTFPNVKIQSNFTFQLASTGDPSTFTFTMDAFPGYTYFNPTKKVLCTIQILEDVDASEAPDTVSLFGHKSDEEIEEAINDNGGEAPTSAKVSVMGQEVALLGRKVSDLISADTHVDANGGVVGTFKHNKDYTGFSSIPADQSGYYFPFKLADDAGTVGTSKMTIVKNGTARVDKTDMPYDSELILKVTKNDKYSIMVNKTGVEGAEEVEVVSLNFARADFK